MQLSLGLDTDPILPRMRTRLLAVQGPQRDTRRADPTSKFIYAMLSSRTYDRVSISTFRLLHQRIPCWDLLPETPVAVIRDIIRRVTFADGKAEHLIDASRIIRAYRGRLELEFLADWDFQTAFDWLMRLPGAGPKVAAATLNFSTLRKRLLVADTHVLRIARRVGLLPKGGDFERGHYSLMRYVPDNWDTDDLYEMHRLLKKHGQTVCRAQRPLCAGCVLAPLCTYASLTVGNASQTHSETTAHSTAAAH